MAVRLQAEGFSISTWSQTADGYTHRQEDGERRRTDDMNKCTTADVRNDSDVAPLFGRECFTV